MLSKGIVQTICTRPQTSFAPRRLRKSSEPHFGGSVRIRSAVTLAVGSEAESRIGASQIFRTSYPKRVVQRQETVHRGKVY